jgi:hypothetical protein
MLQFGETGLAGFMNGYTKSNHCHCFRKCLLATGYECLELGVMIRYRDEKEENEFRSKVETRR